MTTTVLNIQADKQTMLLMHWILSEDGFAVIDALGAQPATLGLRQRPDVVIIDTDIDAREKRACIVALRRLVPGVSIVDLGIDAELARHETGADHYLNKPFSGQDLIARVRACERQPGDTSVTAFGQIKTSYGNRADHADRA